jgi:transposase InsO family protein
MFLVGRSLRLSSLQELARAAAVLEARQAEHGAEVHRLNEVGFCRTRVRAACITLLLFSFHHHQMLVTADGKIEAFLLSTSLARAAAAQGGAASAATAAAAAGDAVAAQDTLAHDHGRWRGARLLITVLASSS